MSLLVLLDRLHDLDLHMSLDLVVWGYVELEIGTGIEVVAHQRLVVDNWNEFGLGQSLDFVLL